VSERRGVPSLPVSPLPFHKAEKMTMAIIHKDSIRNSEFALSSGGRLSVFLHSMASVLKSLQIRKYSTELESIPCRVIDEPDLDCKGSHSYISL
jgi:hypothetical protein